MRLAPAFRLRRFSVPVAKQSLAILTETEAVLGALRLLSLLKNRKEGTKSGLPGWMFGW